MRKAQTTKWIVDSKSIPNADTAEEKGYDAGKKYPVQNCKRKFQMFSLAFIRLLSDRYETGSKNAEILDFRLEIQNQC